MENNRAFQDVKVNIDEEEAVPAVERNNASIRVARTSSNALATAQDSILMQRLESDNSVVVSKPTYSAIDTTNVETMMKGGLGRFYEKLLHHKHAKEYNYGVHFKNLAFRAKLKIRPAQTLSSYLAQPFVKVTGRTVSEMKTVLHPMSGELAPGSLTLMIGGPGSGKTTLLKALAGQIPCNKAKNAFVEINGVDILEVSKQTKIIGFVPQKDEHYPTLTVKETLEFARTCHMGKQQSDRLAELRTEFIMRLLGISHRADTIVGSAAAGIRGVSGGERKRVTIGEALVGEQGFVVMDEMNTGLDSQATLDVVKSMRSWCDVLGGTCVISMLQPQNDVLEVFDSVMLLNAGHLVYNGPIKNVVDHFAKIGLSPPEHTSISDWLLESICGHPEPEHLAQHYENAFSKKALKVCRDLKTVVEEGLDDEELVAESSSKAALSPIVLNSKDGFALSFAEDLGVVFARQWKLNLRNTSLNVSLVIEALVVGLLLGCSFFRVTNIQLLYGLLFYLSSALIRQAWQVIPIVVDCRDIFYKHRDLNMHRTSTFVVSLAVAQLPQNIGAVILLNTIVYFMANLAGGNFVSYLLTTALLILLQQGLRAWMTFFAAASSNANTAQAISAVFVVLALLFSGFILTFPLIEPWFVFIYWVNPLAWGLRSLVQIEFSSDYYGSNTNSFLGLYSFSTDLSFIWIGALVLAGYYIIFGFFFTSVAFHVVRPAQNYLFRTDVEGEEVCELTLSDFDEDEPHGAIVSDPNSIVVELESEETNFVPRSLTVKNLRYAVKTEANEKLELLQGVTAHFPAGTLTCLMGSSGAGKTTLMDVIAGRKTGGEINGDILINGRRMDKISFARIVGYCEQFDTQSPTMTVWESLVFSARLRRVLEKDARSHEAWCEEQLGLLKMSSMKHLRIGGLGIEQRKRLSIAQELSANPSILFLDEPTSGLDAQGAMLCVKAIKKVAQSGRTVFCTIHQPSTEIFREFESLLLLKRGGQIVFYGKLGENFSNLVHYFESIPNTPRIAPQENPASYMLRVIGAGIAMEGVPRPDYAQAYNNSELCLEQAKQVEEVLERVAYEDELILSGQASEDLMRKVSEKKSKFATSTLVQLWECYWRTQRVYFRSPEYTAIRLILSVLIGVFLGGVYFQLGFETKDKVQSQVGIIYLAMDMIGIVSMILVVPITFREREVMERETSSSYYARWVHGITLFAVELPYILLTVMLYVLPSYWMIGLNPTATSFLYHYFGWCVFIIITTFEGIFLSFALPTATVAQVSIGILTGVFNIFSGFLLPFKTIPSALLLFYYVNSDTYVLNTLNVDAFASCPWSFSEIQNNPALATESTSCTLVQDANQTVSEFVVSTYNFNPARRYIDVVVLGVWITVVFISTLLSVQYISYIKR